MKFATAELEDPREVALRKAEAKRASQLQRARENPDDFIEYALRHEKNGARLKNAPFHKEWQELLRDNNRVVLMASVEHAKTQSIGVGKILHLLGTDPSLRIAFVSNTASQASKVLMAIRRHIEENPRLREVFPHLKPSSKAGDPWHTTALTVERPTIARDYSLVAVGAGGAILGSRFDIIIVDDLLNFDNTRTPEMIEKLIDWFDSVLLSRVTDGGSVWVIGTPWNLMDLLHALAARPGWVFRKYAAVLNPGDSPDKWIPRWPQQFSLERLKAIYTAMLPAAFARSYLCECRDDATSRFKEEWLKRALELGKGRKPYQQAPVTPAGRPLPCFTGVDLSMGKTQKSDLVTLVTVAQEGNRRLLCEVQAGRWQAPDILARIKNVYDRFNSIIVVEDNGAQDFLIQWARQLGIPVEPFTTTSRNKNDEQFGVESLAVEFRNEQWIIPSGVLGTQVHPEFEALIKEMLFYSPQSHTGDRLMATWFARERIRGFSQGILATQNTMDR